MKAASELDSFPVTGFNKTIMPRFDNTISQSRSFGPVLGLFLLNLLTRVVTAKYDSYSPFQLSYDPSLWVAYNKPLASYHSSYPYWHPVKDPYQTNPVSYQTYQTLTTSAPFIPSQQLSSGSDYESYYPDYNYHDYDNQYNQIDRLSSNNNNNDVKKFQLQVPEPVLEKTEVTTTLSGYRFEEPIPAESRQPTQRYRKRGPQRRDKYSQKQKRRRSTTPPPEYYASYEDYEPSRRRPTHNRQSEESDYDDGDYYDSFETTTRRYKKRKRRPTRKSSQNGDDSSFEVEATTPSIINPNTQTEIVIVRQAQTTTTTEPNTEITNTTTATQTTTANSTTPSNVTYGYGPSNGNEDVSFTYGPPTGKYQYSVPYFDWYSHEATKNAIVKRVRDIVTFDKKFNLK